MPTKSLNAARTALVVVDMAELFRKGRHAGCCLSPRAIVPIINRLAQATRALRGGIVVWIQTEALINEPDDWAGPQKRRYQRRKAGAAARRCWPRTERASRFY